jgi:two-component system copper resistance phosphate regulon response regulator CusR
MKILVIEDENKTASYLQRGLRENGYVVDIAEDGENGLHCVLTRAYDLVVLDVMLPKRDGWSVLSEMRKAGNQTLALFLTARDELSDRVKGLELGGDGYLVKPFAFSEFLALVRSLLRRGAPRPSETIKLADLEIDTIHYRATRAGRKLDLTPKEFHLLGLLARRSGEILSRAAIAEQVWDMNFDSDSNFVDVHIRRLRAKVDEPFDRKLIQTVRGLGYVLREEER